MGKTGGRVAHDHEVEVGKAERLSKALARLVGQPEDIGQPLPPYPVVDIRFTRAVADEDENDGGVILHGTGGIEHRIQWMDDTEVAGQGDHELFLKPVLLSQRVLPGGGDRSVVR